MDDVRGFFGTLPFPWAASLLHDDAIDGKTLLGWSVPPCVAALFLAQNARWHAGACTRVRVRSGVFRFDGLWRENTHGCRSSLLSVGTAGTAGLCAPLAAAGH